MKRHRGHGYPRAELRLSALPFLLFAIGPLLSPRATSAALAPVQQEEPEEESPKTYADVITAEAITDQGVFDVHMVEDKLYFEIPSSLFGRDMLLVSRIAKVPMGFPGFSPAGVKTGEQVMRWERRGDQVLLRTVSFTNVADDTLAVSISVQVSDRHRALRDGLEQQRSPDARGLRCEAAPERRGLQGNCVQ